MKLQKNKRYYDKFVEEAFIVLDVGNGQYTIVWDNQREEKYDYIRLECDACAESSLLLRLIKCN